MFAGIKTVALAALLSFSLLSSAQAASMYLDFGVEGALPHALIWNYVE